MAATRLMALHIVRDRTLAESLKERMDYTEDELKTEQKRYISTYGCDIETADEEFLLSHREYHANVRDIRKKEIIAYQIRQSFKPGEITPEKANEIGYELAMRFTKGDYAFTVCTHTDRKHIHNHIVFNAISMDGKKKFRNFYYSGIAVRRLSDVLCGENGLSIIKPAPYAERKKNGRYSRKGHFSDKRLEFLKDIEAKVQEGKGKGYEQWAKVFNLKQMASAMCILREEGITSTGQMEEKLAAAISDFEQASDQLKETESEIRELRKMKQHILDYGRTREIYAEYQRRGTPDDYLEAHRAEIQIHLAAKKAFEEFKPKRVPKLKDLNARLSVLSDRQKSQYEQYREARKEMQRWRAVRQSVESSLNRLEKEKHRGVSR